MNQLNRDFQLATENIKLLKTRPTEDELLELYALYKQATHGDCDIPKPGMFDIKAKYKRQSWLKKKGLNKDTAKLQYIELVKILVKKYGQSNYVTCSQYNIVNCVEKPG